MRLMTKVSRPAQGSTGVGPSEKRAPEGLIVLVVDDDPATLRMIAKVASGGGYQVVQARDGNEAWNRIRSDCPDMLVTDWDMPGMDGLALCRRMRQEDLPHYVFTLLLTAKTKPEEMVEGLDAGADDFVSKPLNPAILLARLKAGSRAIAAERRLRELTRIDPLTGLLNHRSFHDRLGVEWNRVLRHSLALSCVMIDLDYFKAVNDTHGHAAGDAVLQAIAEVLVGQGRATEVIARLGGEEFCALLPETDEAGAVAWAERVRHAMAEECIPYSSQILKVTGSFGVASRLADTRTPECLLALADQAMNVAKEAGRNRVVAFSTLDDRGPDDTTSFSFDPLDDVLARDVMAPAVYSPQEDDTVDQVADMFLQLRLNAAPVVNAEARLVGIVSENELLAVAAASQSLNVAIRECMKKDVVQYNEETPVKAIFRFLSRASVPRVVVVNDCQPTGVISRATLLRWLRNWSSVHRRSTGVPGTASALARHAGILRAADAANQRLTVLRSYLAVHDTGIVPCAVDEATRLEGLVHDILAHCRGQDRL